MKKLILIFSFFLIACGQSEQAQITAPEKPLYLGRWEPYHAPGDNNAQPCVKVSGVWSCQSSAVSPPACSGLQYAIFGGVFTLKDNGEMTNGWSDTRFELNNGVISWFPVSNVVAEVDFLDDSMSTAVFTNVPGCSMLYVRVSQ